MTSVLGLDYSNICESHLCAYLNLKRTFSSFLLSLNEATSGKFSGYIVSLDKWRLSNYTHIIVLLLQQ
jgi:hypothetical protein